MNLIIGLGNPDTSLQNTRHNIGRDILIQFAKKNGLPQFRLEKKFDAEITGGKIGKKKLLLALPHDGMNKSGSAVAPLARFYRIKPAAIFVIHDDADIILGRGKLSFNRNSAGHKGVESIIRALKTNAFWRFRIGLAGKRDISAEKIVLSRFLPKERPMVAKIIRKTVDALINALETSPERAMNGYNA
ncbi:MAG: peptidyl-tRNA hydrolase, PTH1 family [Parcubacteria group bacterium Gr01-1014_66]|nr:MAG: peptidyl-tRNA hydrolase, PTH1 family [Parcubacteria group bacterium Gr01-1014_66]